MSKSRVHLKVTNTVSWKKWIYISTFVSHF